MLVYAERHRDVTRYNSACLIGNWSEDRELQRTVLRDMLLKKGTGTLRLDAYHSKVASSLAEVELTRAADVPYIQFGDLLQLVHIDTGCVLAGDPNEKVAGPGEESCSATGAPDIRAPCHRNTLLLLKYKSPKASAVLEPEYDDDVVHYGQKVRLALHPGVTGDQADSGGGPRPLCLFSKPVSTTHAARYSRQQLVGFTYRESFDTVWQIITPDPSLRSVSEGVEVAAGAPVLLVHCATQKPLCLEAARVPTDFGIELEVSGRAALGNGMKLAMEQMAQGIQKGFLPKGELSDNYWTIVTGSKVQQLPEPGFSGGGSSRGGDSALLGALLEELRARPGALSLLERKLVTLESSAGLLPQAELLLVLRQVGSALPEEGAAALVAAFGCGRPGMVDCGALRKALRAAMGQ